LLPDTGIVIKLERTIDKRDPAHQEPSQRSFVQYELQDNMEYKNQLFEDRRHEIQQARKFNESLAPLFPDPSKVGSRPLDPIISLTSYNLQNQPRTPYRDAVLQARRNAEAAKHGESPPATVREAPLVTLGAHVGQKAPDFVVTNLLTKESARSHKWL